MTFWRKKIIPKEPPYLFDQTQALIQQIARQLDGDFFTYWGASNSNIARNDSVAFSQILKTNKDRPDKLFLFIKSSGGSGEASPAGFKPPLFSHGSEVLHGLQ